MATLETRLADLITDLGTDWKDVQTDLDAKQPLDSDLTTIAGLTPTTDNFMQAKAGAWSGRTIAEVKTDLGLTGVNSGDQTSIVGLSGTKAQFDTAVTDGNILYVGDVVGVTDADKGDITVSSSGTVWTIDNNAVAYAKIQDVSATSRVLGRITAGAGDIEELTSTNVRTMLNVADGATANDTDANLKARANHTGTQSADTIVDGSTNKVFTTTDEAVLADLTPTGTPAAYDVAQRNGSNVVAWTAGSNVVARALGWKIAEDYAIDTTGATIHTPAEIQTWLDAGIVYAKGIIGCSGTVTIKDSCDLSEVTWNYTGTSGIAIQVGDPGATTFRKRFRLPHLIATAKTITGWSQVAGTVGVQVANVYTAEVCSIPRVNNFEVGVLFKGIPIGAVIQGVQQVTVQLGHLDNNMVNLKIAPFVGSGTNDSGWANQVTVLGGRLSHNSAEGTQVSGVKHIEIATCPNVVNGWLFLGTSLETPNVVDYHIDTYSQHCTWVGCRFENTGGDAARKVRSRGTAKGNHITRGVNAGQITQSVTDTAYPMDVSTDVMLSHRGGNSTESVLLLENKFSSSGPSLTIMAAGAGTAGSDPTTAWCVKSTAQQWAGKRSTDADARIIVDYVNGRMYVGDATAAPVAYLSGSPSSMGVGGGVIFLPLSNGAQDLGATTLRWRDCWLGGRVRIGAGNQSITSGSGTPEGSVAAEVGSVFMRSDGAAGTAVYVKLTGSSTTGWSALVDASSLTELAQDAVGAMLVDSSTIDLTYTDGTPALTADVKMQMSLTSDASGIKLSADSASPGNNKVYGTDGSGVKGWKSDPAGGVSDGDKGDITISGTGSVYTVDNDVITYAKIQDVSATDRVLGRDTAGAGDVEEITPAALRTMLNVADGATAYSDEAAQDAIGTILIDTATIDFTYTDGTPSITADVNDGSVTYAKMQDVSATSRVLGRITAGAGDVEEITPAQIKTIIGLATSDSPMLTALNLGHATDTTLARVSAGVVSIEGVTIATASNTLTLTNKTLTSPVINTPTGINRSDVGLGNVDNTSNVTERAATATLTNKTLTSPVINAPTGINKSDVGMGNVDNTSNATERAATATLTNKRIAPRTGTTTSSATPTINTDNVDFYSLTAQTADITSFTTNLTGTPTDGQKLWIAITGTAARAITWGASFEASTVALPTTTVTTARLDVGFVWNTVTSKWRCVATC